MIETLKILDTFAGIGGFSYAAHELVGGFETTQFVEIDPFCQKVLKKHFPNEIIGYSDHTLPKDMKVLEYAHLLGANIIEKHFTHDKALPGNDHYHAMDKTDLVAFRQIIERLNTLLISSDFVRLS